MLTKLIIYYSVDYHSKSWLQLGLLLVWPRCENCSKVYQQTLCSMWTLLHKQSPTQCLPTFPDVNSNWIGSHSDGVWFLKTWMLLSSFIILLYVTQQPFCYNKRLNSFYLLILFLNCIRLIFQQINRNKVCIWCFYDVIFCVCFSIFWSYF